MFRLNKADCATFAPLIEPFQVLILFQSFYFMKIKIFTFLLLPLAILLGVSSAQINPNNPPTGRTGAPGETTCQASGCHNGGSFSGTVEITGLPDTVLANQLYNVTLTNTSNASRAGFQLTALNEANQKAGTLVAGAGCSIGSAGGRQYVRQSSPRTLTNGATSWTFNWTAPETVAGDSIHFYFSTLCANGNGQISGDNVLLGVKSVVLPTMVSAVEDAATAPKLLLSPNPTSDFLSVDSPQPGYIQIMDASGRLMLQTDIAGKAKLDIAQFEQGLYFVKFESKTGNWTSVFVKGE